MTAFFTVIMPDFRSTDGFPECPLTGVTDTNPAGESVEEQRAQGPKKVCIVTLRLPSCLQVLTVQGVGETVAPTQQLMS